MAARDRLLQSPALHADETGLRVDGKNHWLHVLTNGSLTVKFLHPERGQAAIDAIDLIPRVRGTLVHDCWASYLGCEQCLHQLRGSHLLRQLTFIESNNHRWARLLKALLQQACHYVNRSQSKVLSAVAYKALRKRYRTILTQGAKELPAIPPRTKGRRGRIAKSAAHNLQEQFVKHEESVLRFLHDPHLSFTNNAGARALRMAKVKMRVSGCFRTQAYGEAYARISSYLQSMAALGYNPLVAIQIALVGQAADMVKEHGGPKLTEAGVVTYFGGSCQGCLAARQSPPDEELEASSISACGTSILQAPWALNYIIPHPIRNPNIVSCTQVRHQQAKSPAEWPVVKSRLKRESH